MASSLVLERPGRWRAAGMAAAAALMLAPALPLLAAVVRSEEPFAPALAPSFTGTIARSLAVAAAVAALALAIGLPAGVFIGLREFTGRRAILALLCLPLLAPSFLWALGWSMLAPVSGFGGCVLAFAGPAVGLTALASVVATRSLGASQIDAARLAGGERAAFREACRSAAAGTALVAALAGVLTLSDPGPGQILGLRTAAAEILVSFAARHDLAAAGSQCLALAGGVLLVAAPLGVLAARRIASAFLARQAPSRAARGGAGVAPVAALACVALLTTVLPAAGLARPLLGDNRLVLAAGEFARTGGTTLVYAAGAAAVALALGLALALCAGRDRRGAALVVSLALAVLALPPALGALGAASAAAAAPPWLDPVLRGDAAVCAVQGLRLAPVAALVALRAWRATSPSWSLAAAVSGVPLGRALRSVFLPAMAPALAAASILAALLAAADIGTVLLLAPPGEATFALAIFTVMGNAREGLIASMCALYLGGAAALLLVVSRLVAGRPGRRRGA